MHTKKTSPPASPQVSTASPHVRYVAWDRSTKRPIDPKTGRFAAVDNPATWGTHDEATRFAEAHPDTAGGVGFVFVQADGLVGIDLDGCCDPESGDVVEDWAQNIIDAHPDAFLRPSPSRTGVHLIVRGELPTGQTGKKVQFKQTYFKGGKDHQQGIEVYHDRRHFTACEGFEPDRVDGQLDLPSIEAVVYEQTGRHIQWKAAGSKRKRSSSRTQPPPIPGKAPPPPGADRESQARALAMISALCDPNDELFNEKFASTWAWERADRPDWTQSEYDSSIVSQLAALDVAEDLIQECVYLHRQQHRGKSAHPPEKALRADYFDGLLELTEARRPRAATTKSSHDTGKGAEGSSRPAPGSAPPAPPPSPVQTSDPESLAVQLRKKLKGKNRRRKGGPPPSDLPAVIINGGDLPSVVDQAERALMAAEEARHPHRELFLQGQRVVQLARQGTETIISGIVVPAGAAVITRAMIPNLRERFTASAQFLKPSEQSEKLRVVDCPVGVASAYLAREGSHALPRIRGVLSSPTMRPDGSLVITPGYDARSEFYLDIPKSGWTPAIPDEPSRDEALAALEVLRHPFRAFTWESSLDETAHLACILTLLARAAVDRVPLFAYSATTPGSGKSKLAECASVIALGRCAPMATGSASREELRKTVDALLMQGAPTCIFDNIEWPFESPDLCKAITAELVDARVLGESRVVTVPSQTVFIATGNGLTLVGDLNRRALLCALDPRVERPEERDFDFEVVKEVRDNRDKLAAAGLTVMRAYWVAGRPAVSVTRPGSFESWSDFVLAPLVWLGLPDPWPGTCRLRERDPVGAMLGAILDLWHARFGERATTVREATKSGGQDLKEALESAAEQLDPTRPANAVLGSWLQKVQRRVANGGWFERAGTRGGVAAWRAVKTCGGEADAR